ncbi:hypothetical protein [Thermococcus sp.]
MKYSRIAVRLFEGKEVFYDPVYHGRTLKVFGMDNYPDQAIEFFVDAYRKIGYSVVVFDTKGTFERDGFDTIIDLEDAKPGGLDPIKFASKGYFDPYTAATIVQTVYGLDRTLTDKLYSDILSGRVGSVPEALKAGEKYSEVIAESYTLIDQLLYSGDVPVFGENVLVNLGDAHSITLVGTAFLVLSAVFEKRRETLVGLNDAAVLAYTQAGSAGLALLTRPLRRRVTVVASEYAGESLLNLGGPVLLLYHEPDVQGIVYDASGVPPGPMRKYIQKGEGAFIYRTPETINVETGKFLG